MDYKQAFLSQLENSYLGVQIQDSKDLFSQDLGSQDSGSQDSISKQTLKKSGFINLLQMKSKYFQHIKTLLEKENLNHNIYTKLYNFFSSYLNETGTPFFYDTPMHKNIYAKVYTNSKDTSLFYKTQNLYYVKSDTLYHDAEITSEDFAYTFIFDTSYFIPNADNAKNKVIFKFAIEENIRIYVLNDKESLKDLPPVFKQNSTELSEDFLKALKNEKIMLKEEEIKKILSSYKKQNEIDFFIHKNARAFLQEQFNLWLCNYVLDDITQWKQEKIEELNTLKKVAFSIIDYIADFEDELKAIWCKPKFAKKVEYVFSLDRIGSALLDSVINDEGFKAQIKEWQELRLIDESFDIKNINDEKYKFLPLDTKHFSKTTKYKILSTFEDIESILNGELIKSDNFQALNTLLPKYQNKVDLTYIDPPYNAPASEIIYKNNFKDSTWLAMMANRLELAKEFLSERGILSCAIDENEQENLGLLLSDIFYEYEKTCVSVEHNPKGIQGDNFSYSNEFAYFLIPNDTEIQNEIIEMQYKELMKTGKESERHTAKNCFYPIYVKDSKIIGFGEVCKEDFHPQKKIIDNKGILEIYPIDSNGNERKWRYSRESVESVKENLKAFFTKDSITIKLGKTEKSFKTMWYGAKYSATEYGSKILKDIIPNNDFDYPKSIHTVKDSIYLASKEDSTILDFFGGSGTTAHAVLELNREGSNRKFVLVEMGEHFYNVIIPRIKKVAFSSEWKNGELKNAKQVNPISIAFRYYELESYEESLSNCEYMLDKDSIIDYRKSRKLIKALNKGETISLDMNGYREGFDILHTMANILGLKIQRLFLDSKGIECAEFDNGDRVSSDSVDLCKYPKLTNLIWWER
ncbi:site-specific DNA-methyltransferase [Helicobacter pullorum]|uniref:site-specific DNA-methyltransferase n=1 Tax=Helicobacter pullorum TaxID=35818 RepID=UPI0008169B3E|nr:site-specific DNA-methyltransferase [Helicobacter pullorum]OCR16901.1 restriction endonuclease [Helicobacter pullorum]